MLLVRPGALGDAVLTLPVLHALLHAAGVRRVTVLGNPASWGFLRADAAVRLQDIDAAMWLGLFGAGAGLPEAAGRLLGEADAALAYFGVPATRARVVARLRAAGIGCVLAAAPPRRGPPGSSRSGGPGEAAGVAPLGPGHAARRLLAPLAGGGGWPGLAADALAGFLRPAPLAEDGLLAPTAAEVAAVRRLPGLGDAAGAGLLAIHPGSGGATKCWPAARFVELAAYAAGSRGLTPVVLFGPADEVVRRAFEAAAAGRLRRWVPAAGRGLREVLALLSLARAYVGNDSGVSHLAARACPSLVLFGPSDPAVWRPVGRAVAVLRAPGHRMEALTIGAAALALDRLLDA